MSDPSGNGPVHDWEKFFSLTGKLPSTEYTRRFLTYLPPEGRMLDFGCGSGRWAAAFRRDKPGLTIDVLDQHLDKAALIPSDWRGEKFQTDFADFKPAHTYDGIWAFATLFFLPLGPMVETFHRLAGALKPDGVLAFTMVSDCPAAQETRFTGMDRKGIEAMIIAERLKVLSIHLNEQAEYGPRKSKIPTFHVFAQKPNSPTPGI